MLLKVTMPLAAGRAVGLAMGASHSQASEASRASGWQFLRATTGGVAHPDKPSQGVQCSL
jgi:hypothetical protein